MRKRDIDTPALLLDLEVMEENLRSDGGVLRESSAKAAARISRRRRLPRSRAASSKPARSESPPSKLGEVEVLSRAGLGPILLANQIVGAKKIERLFALPPEAGNHRHRRKRIECSRT